MAAFNAIQLLPEDVPGAVLPDPDPNKCKVAPLKRWLEIYGQKKTGNLKQLRERVIQTMKLKLPIDPKVDGGGPYEKKEQLSKLRNAVW